MQEKTRINRLFCEAALESKVESTNLSVKTENVRFIAIQDAATDKGMCIFFRK